MDIGFQGYRRADNRIGTRNHLLILSVTGLTGPAARRIGRSLPHAVVVATPFGSGLLGQDALVHERVLRGFATHPNVGAVVVLGGDETRVEGIRAAVAASGREVAAFAIDHCDHDLLTLADRGIRAGATLMRRISRIPREPCRLADLTLGLECGRSDPSSGLVANPLLGRIADAVTNAGGKAMIGETTEWLGAEHLLAERAATPELARRILGAAYAREAMAVAAGIDLTGNNPSKTNIDAGLSSIEEKSLGAIAKSGTGPIVGLLDYGQPPACPGIHVMDAPAYAPESVTGFTAAGANLVLFTTGVGNAYGSALAPTIKVSANPETCRRLAEQLDFTASAMFEGQMSMDEGAAGLMEVVLATASGGLTFAEILGETDEVISRFGPAL